MSDSNKIEVTGGAYKDREGLVVMHENGRVRVMAWYDGGAALEVEIDLPAAEFLRQLGLPDNSSAS